MPVSKEYPGIVIVGPTATGKSRLAIGLARRFGGEIIGCDALQIYRHMNIGTAKIMPNEREGIRHHMLDVQDPDRDFSAGDYQRMARNSLQDIKSRGNLPLIVGGTGFYLRALIDGLFDGPSRSEENRARMRCILQRKGSRILHRSLRRVDPDSAARIAETDAERILRAYEAYLVSGKSMSWWQRQPRNALQGYRWLKIGIHMHRESLYRRINQRTEEMFRAGLLEETRELLKKFPRESHAFKAIGYRQAAEYLDGRLSLEQAVEEAQKQSRRYAKRQLTWFRPDPDIVWLDGHLALEELQEKAADLVRRFLHIEGGGRSAADHRLPDTPSN